MSMEENKVRIAIVGGGLAGIFLLRGLNQLEHLDVHIFESRSTFREEGAGIALGRNAVSALQSVDSTILDCLDRAGAVRPKASHCWMGAGPHAGMQLPDCYVAEEEEGKEIIEERTCFRQAFLTQLLATLPQERMHTTKRLCRIDDAHAATGRGRLILHFEDETQDAFDIVFGADGVNSKLRKYVLGDHPSAEATPVGQWHLLQMVPIAEAKEAFGEHLDEKSSDQRGWIGRKTYVLQDFHDDMHTVQIVVASNEDSEELEREKSKRKVLTHAHFKELLSGQLPHLSKGVANLICKHSPEQITAYCQFAHTPAPTIFKGRVCLVGDAAHATSPSMASGGGMSCEDACILTALLREAKTLDQIEAAFEAYDITRRPRCNDIITASEKTGRVMTGGYGVDKDIVAENLIYNWVFIDSWRADVEIAKVLQVYEAKLADRV